jgi:DNA-binding transcriptional ArsR family regulator
MLAAMRPFPHPAAETFELPRVLHALSDPARLDMVRRIADSGELTCGALTDERPKSSMSHHFRVLREAGLVRTRIAGSEHLNTLRREDIEARFPGLLAVVLAGR